LILDPPIMKKRSAIKTDLFAEQHHREKIDTLGDPLTEIEAAIDFAALAAEVDRIAPRPTSPRGGRPPFPTETMVRILVLNPDCPLGGPTGLRTPWRSLFGVFAPMLVANRLGYWLLPRARIHSQTAAPSSCVPMDNLG
jgi:hypothetical protein